MKKTLTAWLVAGLAFPLFAEVPQQSQAPRAAAPALVPDPQATALSEHLAALDPQQVQLGSVKAAVYDTVTGTLLYEKNAHVPVPIASVTKLMTAMVILDGGQSLDDMLTIKRVERDTDKNAYSRMRIGSQLSRGSLLRLALMASENLAASTLGHNYPGGFDAFVDAMNTKAKALGMTQTTFVDATGLSPRNHSTAADLVKMVTAAAQYDIIRDYSTAQRFTAQFDNPRYRLVYGNTNRLVHRSGWQIELTKTGYLNEAGRCLVMLTEVDDYKVAMVLLDSFGKLTPIGDAGRIKRWLTTGSSGSIAGAALDYERRRAAAYK